MEKFVPLWSTASMCAAKVIPGNPNGGVKLLNCSLPALNEMFSFVLRDFLKALSPKPFF